MLNGFKGKWIGCGMGNWGYILWGDIDSSRNIGILVCGSRVFYRLGFRDGMIVSGVRSKITVSLVSY